jgi:hypothetical protein
MKYENMVRAYRVRSDLEMLENSKKEFLELKDEISKIGIESASGSFSLNCFAKNKFVSVSVEIDEHVLALVESSFNTRIEGYKNELRELGVEL